MKLKLYRVTKIYGENVMEEFYFAYSIRGVYTLALWNKGDKPKLRIKRVPIKQGCFFSVEYMHSLNLTELK